MSQLSFPLLTVLSLILDEPLTLPEMASTDQLVEYMIGRPLSEAIRADAYEKCRKSLITILPQLSPALIPQAQIAKLKLTLNGAPECVSEWIKDFCAWDEELAENLTVLPLSADTPFGEWNIVFEAIADIRQQDKQTPWGAAIVRGLWNLHDAGGDDFRVSAACAFLCQLEKASPQLSRRLLHAREPVSELRPISGDGQVEVLVAVATIENWEKQSGETATAEIAAELVTQLAIFAAYVRSHCLPYDVKDPNKGILFFT